jgi:putative inorganic carbon (HCO3(-)) transporter
MKDWSMPASTDSALEVNADRPWSGKIALPNLDSPPNLPSIEANLVDPGRQPRWNLAFFGILSYMFVEYTRLPEIYPILQPLQLGKALVALAAVGWLLSPRTQGGPRTVNRSIDLSLCAFLAACLGSALFAEHSALAMLHFLDVFQWAVVYFLISRTVSTSWRMRIFVLLLLLLCFKLSQFEIRDYLGERAFGRSDVFLSTHGVGAGSTGFFGNGGDFGVAMCVVWPLAGSLLFGEPKKLTRLFLLVCFVAFLISIFLCGSRGAILGAGVIALVSWAKQPKRIIGAAMIGLLVLGVYMLPGATMDRLRGTNGEQDDTAQMRIHLWKAGIDMFEHHPIFGVGLGNFGSTYIAEYGGQSTTPTVHVEHSIYVQALAETGLAGTLPLLALWILFFRVNRRTRSRLKALGLANRTCFEYRLSVGLDLALIGYMVSGAFITVLFYPHLWYLLGLCAALHTSCIGKQSDRATAQLDLGEQMGKPSLLASYR